MPLTAKQATFVREYLTDLNGTQTAIRAGYSARTANEQAAQLLAKLSVREAIDKAQVERAERLDINADWVVRNFRNLYLEALDRDVKKEKENPSIGILLCKDRDAELVEYALNRSMSPTLIAEYNTWLPDKKILQQKLHELFENSNEPQ